VNLNINLHVHSKQSCCGGRNDNTDIIRLVFSATYLLTYWTTPQTASRCQVIDATTGYLTIIRAFKLAWYYVVMRMRKIEPEVDECAWQQTSGVFHWNVTIARRCLQSCQQSARPWSTKICQRCLVVVRHDFNNRLRLMRNTLRLFDAVKHRDVFCAYIFYSFN